MTIQIIIFQVRDFIFTDNLIPRSFFWIRQFFSIFAIFYWAQELKFIYFFVNFACLELWLIKVLLIYDIIVVYRYFRLLECYILLKFFSYFWLIFWYYRSSINVDDIGNCWFGTLEVFSVLIDFTFRFLRGEIWLNFQIEFMHSEFG